MSETKSRRPIYIIGGALVCAVVGGLLLWLVPGKAKPEAAPAQTTTATIVPTITSAALTKLAPKYSTRLEAARTTPCDGAAMFSVDCGNFMVRAKNLGTEVAEDADRLGSAYGKVALAGRGWASAADQWVSTCMTSEAGSSTRSACLKVMNPAINGAEGVLAAIYDIETR